MDLTTTMTGIFGGFEFALSYAKGIDFSELSSVNLADDDFVKELPIESAVYFVLNDRQEPVYIGKAIRLQERWRNHHCLKRAIEHPGMRLAWVKIVPVYLMMMESLFIMAFRPAWNQKEFFEDGDYWFPSAPERFQDIWNKPNTQPSTLSDLETFGGNEVMINKEIVEEVREVKEMNWREAERARMTPEEIAVQQRANELVLRIGRIGDDETMSPIFKEALMNERRIAIEGEREACAKIADELEYDPKFFYWQAVAAAIRDKIRFSMAKE